MKKISQIITANTFRETVGIVLCFVVTCIAALPLFHAGLFPTVDNISVVRLDDMSQELLRGQFPVRYLSDLAHTHGYMLFNFYGSLPFYFGSVLHILGTNLVGAVKRTFFVALVMGTFSMYLFSRQFMSRKGAIVSTILFIFSPYLGYDIYTRGGLGEVWAYTLLPLVFWAFYMVSQKGKVLYVLSGAISLAAIIISHNLTAYIAIPFIVVWTLIFMKRKYMFSSLAALVLACGISAFFWIPVIAEKSSVWVVYNEITFSSFQTYLLHSVKDFLFPYPPAKVNFLTIILPIIALPFFWKAKSNNRKIFFVTGIFFIVSFFLTTDFSQYIWKYFYNVTYIIQFPWRMLIITSLFSAFIVGMFVSLISKKNIAVGLGVVIIAMTLVMNYSNFRPKYYEFVPQYKAEDPCGTTWGVEYLPIWVRSCFTEGSNLPLEVSSGTATITGVTSTPRYYKARVNSKGSIVRINAYYYPGWTASIDGSPTPILYKENPYGMIEVVVPSGNHTVVVKFTDTLRTKLSDVISSVSWVIVVVFGIILLIRRVIWGKKHLKK